MTVMEALKKSMDILNGVNIPISMTQKIGIPVNDAVSLIQASVTALENAANKEGQHEEPEEGEGNE